MKAQLNLINHIGQGIENNERNVYHLLNVLSKMICRHTMELNGISIKSCDVGYFRLINDLKINAFMD